MIALSLHSIKKIISKLQANTEGQDLVEYALLTGFMVVAVWAFFPTSVVPSISTIFSRLTSTASVLVP
jgi:Flp pilus assembly pilin Flp